MNNEDMKKMIEQSKLIAERIETANKRTEELLTQQEKYRVKTVNAGATEAGVVEKVKTEEEMSIDSARAMLSGTGYEDILFPK